MTYKEEKWDKLLQIRTCGRDDSRADEYRYPYEPTPYCVLERLGDSGLIREENTVLDYGCGKGRVDFFLSHYTGAKAIGIEYDAEIYAQAQENRKTAKAKADFLLTRAEAYQVPPEVDRCYFFNPFSTEILHKVMARILESYYESPRHILLFFYYPSEDYLSYLMTVNELEFFQEIPCNDLFQNSDPRERLVIFSLHSF